MLIIISDLHLGDGTCGRSISAAAFHLFRDRLIELARNASYRADGRYEPIGEVDILLLGDIIEALHSIRWLDTLPGQPGYVRPWTDPRAPEFARKIEQITLAALEQNQEALGILRRLTEPGGLTLPPVDGSGKPDEHAAQRHEVQVRIHYMVGNHDWFYHLSGAPFNRIREQITTAIGLSNPPGRFPHDINERGAGWLKTLLERYSVYARHGDVYDSFNFHENRDQSSIGDVFAVEILNRFALEAAIQFNGVLPDTLLESLKELVNVRPALATPLWISSQLRQNNVPPKEREELKALWDSLCRDFIELEPIRKADRKRKIDLVDWFEMGIRLTDAISFKTLDDIVLWVRRKFWPNDEIKFANYALSEKAFKEEAAQFIVYGHTHHHEVVPLDDIPTAPLPTSQLYLNSGTWHTYFDLAIYKPEEQKFVPYQVLSYLAFFCGDERGGRHFETWSGTFSD